MCAEMGKAPEVPVEVLGVGLEVDYGIHDKLSRAMIGHLPPALRLVQRLRGSSRVTHMKGQERCGGGVVLAWPRATLTRGGLDTSNLRCSFELPLPSVYTGGCCTNRSASRGLTEPALALEATTVFIHRCAASYGTSCRE